MPRFPPHAHVRSAPRRKTRLRELARRSIAR
jgi:hypothetical protein